MFDWRRPTNLGVKDGRLAPCKRSPNCVSSQADPLDKEHYVAPISYAGSIAELRKALATLNLATVIREEPDYLYAEFRTPFLRFVDDVEFLKDGEVLHVRSASRLGRRDFKANRKRVEQLRSFLRQTP
jgi:uncharacterized protein (DUF1499 family)